MIAEEWVGDGSDGKGPVDHSLGLEDALGPNQVRDEERVEGRLQHDGVVVLALANVGPVALDLAFVEIRLEVDDVVFYELDAVAGGLFVLWSLRDVLQDLVSLRSPRCLPSCGAFLRTF